tara:strand:+ start:9701 stop:10135 length:435 start_codon:yes stop_codon:yes gene_type:complete
VTTAKTSAERQAAFRARKAAAEVTEVRGIFAPPDRHDDIRTAAAKIAKRKVRAVKPIEVPTVKRYKVPAKFWDDFSDRGPCDGDPETAMPQEVSRSSSRVLIAGTDAQIEWLRSDAKHYSDKWGPDEISSGLKASAASTVKALA